MTPQSSDAPAVAVLPVESDPPWRAACPCGFEDAAATYRAIYATAQHHHGEHYGPEHRSWPGGPVGYGNVVAISPDASGEDIAATRALWLYFAATWEPERLNDPEAWLVFLNHVQAESEEGEEAVLSYRRAFRATGMARAIDRARREPRWDDRLYELAERLIAADEEDWEWDLVLTGDGLTLERLAALVGDVGVLSKRLRRRYGPVDEPTDSAGPRPPP